MLSTIKEYLKLLGKGQIRKYESMWEDIEYEIFKDYQRKRVNMKILEHTRKNWEKIKNVKDFLRKSIKKMF